MKTTNSLFFNEDTLAIEVCIKLKSQIDAWKSTFPLSREWKSTFPLSREWKSCNPCMYTMLRQQIYMQWHYQLSAICQMRRMWNDANAENMKFVIFAVIVSVHSVSDYKKRLYKKRLVELLKCKKRQLVTFFQLRNTLLMRLSKFIFVRNDYTKLYVGNERGSKHHYLVCALLLNFCFFV